MIKTNTKQPHTNTSITPITEYFLIRATNPNIYEK